VRLPIYEPEKETFREVDNILIGACIGKIAEFLGDVMTYSPPRAAVERIRRGIISDNLFAQDHPAIVLRTVWELNEKKSAAIFLLSPVRNHLPG